MGCVCRRGNKLWIRFKGPDGRWATQQKTSHSVGSEGIGGPRLGEVAGLRFRHRDAGLAPLGAILVATSFDKGRTKTKQPRRMPVHPAFAAVPAEWEQSGWGRP